MRPVFLVKRGPRPSYHVAPFHPVIVTDNRKAAEWEAGWTGDGASVWQHDRAREAGGWLVSRWCGFDIDYGHIVRGCSLPDGTTTGFVHDKSAEPWTLLRGATWWSLKPMPQWIADAGTAYPADRFTQQHIADLIRPISGAMGPFSVEITGTGQNEVPTFWPTPAKEGESE